MEKKTKLTWRELKERFPKAFEKHVESILDWMDDEGSGTIFVNEDTSELFWEGFFPGEEYGGDVRVVWTGTDWEEYEDEDEE